METLSYCQLMERCLAAETRAEEAYQNGKVMFNRVCELERQISVIRGKYESQSFTGAGDDLLSRGMGDAAILQGAK